MRTHRFSGVRTRVLALGFVGAGVVQAATYVVVDTGQTECFDDSSVIAAPQPGAAFYGQDAQHDGTQPAYQDNGDGTVADLATGLTWVQACGSKMTFAEAVSGASACRVGGHSDWRLPSIKELYSLILFCGVDPSGYQGSDASGLIPFINTDSFKFEYGDTSTGERIIDAQCWSSTEYVSTTMGGDATVFGVNFADGRIKGYPQASPMGGDKTLFVRYVRGHADYGVNDFVDNGNETVTDQATERMWDQGDSTDGLDWSEALAFVQMANADNHLGHNDWRLPNAKELQSIVDYTRSPATSDSAAIDPVFNVTSIINEGGETDYPSYWSSTTHENMQNGGFAAYVCFGRALGYMTSPFGTTALLDVHGAGAQRSDPKSGDPADWPTGNGPQGDVMRDLASLPFSRSMSSRSRPAILILASDTLKGVLIYSERSTVKSLRIAPLQV